MASKSYDRPMTHQEYVKLKYGSQNDYEPSVTKKKRKKTSNIKAPSVKIVDDDIDFRKFVKNDSDEEELYFGTKEEKPIITAVIDERPLHMRGDNVDRGKWKVVGGSDESDDKRPDTETLNKTEKVSTNKQKTLSGKKAGLSDAKEIKKELAELKVKNEQILKNLSDDISGKNAKTVFRDRGSGKIRDLEKELLEKQEEDRKQKLKEAEKKAVYDRWSKGVVQREEQLKKVEDDLHEMSKPLARYENDSDLEKLLREREREDDPMLKEIRKKRKEEEKAKNPFYQEYPQYQGPPPPPNRFNIKPGYRWDGVDRSNGYENKCFSRLANREASQEESYRWSTQDM